MRTKSDFYFLYINMSRSRKYHPFITWCPGSNKKDKILANRRFRRLSKTMIHRYKNPPHKLREVSNVYNFNTDGLAFYWSKKDCEEFYNTCYYNHTKDSFNQYWKKQIKK